MSKEDRVKQMHEFIDLVADPRSAVHEVYKAKMKDILWTFTNHLTEIMIQLPEDSDKAREIVQTFIDEFVERSFIPQ